MMNLKLFHYSICKECKIFMKMNVLGPFAFIFISKCLNKP